MGLALKELKKIGLEKIEKYETELTKIAYQGLKEIKGVKLLVSEKHLSTVIPFVIEGKSATVVAEELNDKYAIGVRAGNFCVYHVVRDLLKITPKQEKQIIADVENGDTSSMPGVIRASFSICNNEEDVKRLVDAVRQIANK